MRAAARRLLLALQAHTGFGAEPGACDLASDVLDVLDALVGLVLAYAVAVRRCPAPGPARA